MHSRTRCLAEQHAKPCCSLMTVLARFCFTTLLLNKCMTSLESVTGATIRMTFKPYIIHLIPYGRAWTRFSWNTSMVKKIDYTNRSRGTYLEKTVLESSLDLVSLGCANVAFRRSSDTKWSVACFTTSSPKLICALSLKLTTLQLPGKASTFVTLLEDRSNNCRTWLNGQLLMIFHVSNELSAIHVSNELPASVYGIGPVKLQSAALKIRTSLHPMKGLSSSPTVMFNEIPVMSKVVKAGKGQLNPSQKL